VVTEPGLTLDRVEAALAAQGGTEPFVLGRHRAVVSSGSSGRRGVFLYGWDDWITVVLLRTRWDVYVGSPLLEPGAVTASFFADKTMHVSGALHAFTSNDDVRVLHLPVSLPLPEVVGRLNEAQPTALIGYPTSVSLAVEEAEAGRLAIRPSLVGTCGELLTDGLRDRVRAVWGLEVRDEWGVSEGVFALPCVPGRPLHLPDDLCIIEPVDAGGRVVAPGTPAARILLTNLYNRTQPLIRYEINDPMTLLDEPCACGCAHRRITGIGGRVEEPFVYAGGTVVHPVALGDPLLLDPAVLDFQVRQTASGVEVSVRTPGAGVDLEPFRRQLVAVLLAAGIPEPTVLISRVDAFDRLWSGKQPRFVRLV
jgi:phenylacetate-coenzyme A ligase PaaK-like adenylate-forming protein